MKKNKYIIGTILWMFVIFYMSHQIGDMSSNSSSTIVNMISYFIDIPSTYIPTVELCIRKLAHISEYAILAWLVFQASIPFTKKPYLVTFLLSVGYACSDEFHQYFIPGRAATITDVLIDSIGIIFTLTLLYFFYKKRNNT